MGSINATGIPVASKTNTTFRKQDIRITSTNSVTDVESIITSHRPSLSRVISSGSIVRDDNVSAATVDYYEDVTWGVNFGSRSTNARIARTGARNLDVDDEPSIVIPTGLAPNTPQEWTYQLGNKVVAKDSVTDAISERIANTGVFG